MINFSDLSLSFNKHLYESVGSVYYCHFSKLSVGDSFTEERWIQPIWGDIPRYLCATLVPIVLRCQTIITNDQLLINLRQMADYCVEVYKKDFDNPMDETNNIPVYKWTGDTPIPTGGYIETFVDRIVELPVNPYDSVAAINIYINLLVCCDNIRN